MQWGENRERGFLITIPPDARGGVLEDASPELAGGCSVVHFLFQEWLGGGGGQGVGLLPWGPCYCIAGRMPGKNQSMVIARLLTILSSPGLDSLLEEFTNSTTDCSGS